MKFLVFDCIIAQLKVYIGSESAYENCPSLTESLNSPVYIAGFNINLINFLGSSEIQFCGFWQSFIHSQRITRGEVRLKSYQFLVGWRKINRWVDIISGFGDWEWISIKSHRIRIPVMQNCWDVDPRILMELLWWPQNDAMDSHITARIGGNFWLKNHIGRG